VVDGTVAPGHRRGGPPVVEIDCAGRAGLRFSRGSAGSQLLGVAVDDASGDGVTLQAGSITIDADYIGLDLAGRPAGNRGDGLYLSPSSSRDLIGLNPAGATGVVANVISANGRNGIALRGSSGDTLVSNRVGTNPAGTAALGNRANGLLLAGGARRDEIGGTAFVDPATGQANDPTGNEGTVTPVFVVPPLGNLISGNRRAGVLITSGSAGNVLNGNFIGTTADGDAALGNRGDGVLIVRADRNSLVGCRFVNNPFAYYNVVSANGGDGLAVTDSAGTVVQGNFFGVGANNTTVLGNRRNGIAVGGTSVSTQVGGVIPLGNVSSGNGENGIAVTGRVRGFVTFNTFGGLLAFKGAAPNHHDGLLITATGGDNLARTNVFSGNDRNGIEISGNARGMTVDPDIVGMNTRGTGALPNHGDGVLIDGNAHGNTIGGTRRSVIRQNTFSANGGFGLAITGRAHGNRVLASYIGTDIDGRSAFGNRRGGVLVGGHAYRNAIGTLRPRIRPVTLISGNQGNGITLLAGTSFNRVVGNLIGLNRLRRPLPNGRHQVVNHGHRNTIRANRILAQ
jgi:hypothetical protein